jgi:hypothetical protein
MKRVGFILLFLLVISVIIYAEYIAYPNPIRSDGNLTIESTSGYLPRIVKVYDMNGRLVMRKDVGNYNKSIVISFLRLKHGSYIIVLDSR